MEERKGGGKGGAANRISIDRRKTIKWLPCARQLANHLREKKPDLTTARARNLLSPEKRTRAGAA